MQFIKYIFLCDLECLIALVLFMVGAAILITKLIGHYTSHNVKNASNHLSRHLLAVLFALVFIIAGIIGVSISIKKGFEEISSTKYHQLKTELSEFPVIQSIVANELKGRQYINQMTYCSIIGEIDKYKKNKAKNVLLPGKPRAPALKFEQIDR